MNTTSTLKLIACLAWAGVAISSATPASAIAFTYTAGASYASCSADTEVINWELCGIPFEYYQTIKFVSTACSSGGCAGQGDTYVEFAYSPGRKVATFWSGCTDSAATGNLYNLGSCAC
jgi:hypothetical protein